jgi:antitoxin MazE
MRTRIVAIGNSQGIRIPKALMGGLALGAEVELGAEGDTLVIRPVRTARSGWAEAAQALAREGGDALLDPDQTGHSAFDRNEWVWSKSGGRKRPAI